MVLLILIVEFEVVEELDGDVYEKNYPDGQEAEQVPLNNVKMDDEHYVQKVVELH